MSNIKRITSIDALRAITLFGILLVHVLGTFGWGIVPSATSVGNYIQVEISSLLVNRCANVFAMLFGVSFYLILRNPANTGKKFVWRCFLLVLIGLFNKVFYTPDALMWYGLWGMVLVVFRNLSVKKLWILTAAMFVLNLCLRHCFHWHFTNTRYAQADGLWDVISYPFWQAALDYMRIVMRGGVLYCLDLFLLGYAIAKSGIVENIKQYATIKNFLVLTVLYMGLFFIYEHFSMPDIRILKNISGAFCYAVLFLLIYYKTYPFLRFLEPYGKLGLTNYSMQGIIGVILSAVVFIPCHWPFEYILITMLLFYVLQVLFSIAWLKHHRFGPMEWLWRCGTEKKWLSNVK